MGTLRFELVVCRGFAQRQAGDGDHEPGLVRAHEWA